MRYIFVKKIGEITEKSANCTYPGVGGGPVEAGVQLDGAGEVDRGQEGGGDVLQVRQPKHYKGVQNFPLEFP